jgi:hypothetical protein
VRASLDLRDRLVFVSSPRGYFARYDVHLATRLLETLVAPQEIESCPSAFQTDARTSYAREPKLWSGVSDLNRC